MSVSKYLIFKLGETCGKKKFDELGAMMALVSAKQSKKRKRRETRYYFCEKCNAYHLTSKGGG